MALFKNDNNELLEKIDIIFQNQMNETLGKSFEQYIIQFQELVDEEKKIIENSTREAIAKLEKFEKLDKQFLYLNNVIIELNKEIRKRDTIVKRKEKQIERLKEEKWNLK